MKYELDTFTRQYLETALWASMDEHDEPFDANWSVGDFAPESVAQAVKDCAAFQEENAALLEGFDLGTAGHDFWLTRNRHGAGFWDGEYRKETGEKLTQACRKYRELNLFEVNGYVFIE